MGRERPMEPDSRPEPVSRPEPDSRTHGRLDANAGARHGGRRGRSRLRTRANACLISLLGTTLTGWLLHGRIPHGKGWEAAVSPAGGVAGLRAVHVVCAAAFMTLLIWHLVDKRRTLLASLRRPDGRNLRRVLANVALAGLLVASLLTSFWGDAGSQVIHHTAVSMVLVSAYAWHGVSRMRRKNRMSRHVPVGAGS